MTANKPNAKRKTVKSVQGPAPKKAPAPEKPGGETTEQIVSRVKRDMLWVAVSALVAMGLGFAAGQLVKF
ncbi:MAG: hypothetical protein ACPLQO_06945 [Desulfotomaculales bacterium]